MAEAPKTNQQSREDGIEIGRILGRLDAIETHSKAVNGSIDRSADELHSLRKEHFEMRMLVQALGKEAQADRDKAIALAVALKEAEEKRYSPFARLWQIVGAVAALVAIAAGGLKLMGMI